MATCPPEPCKPTTAGSATPDVTSCPPLSFDAGNYSVKYNGKCLTKEKRPNAIKDGWYSRVRIVDGVIVEAQEQSGQQVVIENPCAAASSGNDGSIGVSLDTCNLTMMTSDGLLNTRLFYVPDRFLTVSGCGSPSSPLVYSLDIAGIQASVLAGGTNFTGCGIDIKNGVVMSFTQPITNIVSNNPALQVIRDGCTISLNVTASSMSVVYSRPWCRVGTNGQRIFQGMAAVLRGAGNTANVIVYPVSEGVAMPAIPSSFGNTQEAITWVDANMTC